MGCGSSIGQVHDTHNKDKSSNLDSNHKYVIELQQKQPFSEGRCYLFGQSAIQKKVVCYDTAHHSFEIISSRVRIPSPKIHLQAIEILYQQSQDIISPDLFKQLPKPPFNCMFGTFFRSDTIFLCGGTTYEIDQVSSESFFYRLNLDKEQNIGTMHRFKKFQNTAPMLYPRYNHFGVFKVQKDDGVIFVFGGINASGEIMATCQKFSINEKKWTELPSMMIPRSEGSAFLFMEKIYVMGGMASEHQLPKTIEVYDPQKNFWNKLDIKIHRGIRGGLLITPNENEILLFGGCSAWKNSELKSVIKFNLIEQTYQWQSDMPTEMYTCKAAISKQAITIFGSGKNNLIEQYNIKERSWKNLNYGFSNYIPVGDIKKFTCVAEPLRVNFKDVQPKQKVDKKLGIAESYLFGNQDYPFICRLSFDQKLVSLFYRFEAVPMMIRLSSKMHLIQLQKGIMLYGGTDSRKMKGQNSIFMFNYMDSAQELPSGNLGRYGCSSQHIDNNIYIIGGIIDNSANILCSQIQMYNIQKQIWQKGPKLNKGRSYLKTSKFGSTKILIVGGYEENMEVCPILQIYDTQKNQVIKMKEMAELLDERYTCFELQEIEYKSQLYTGIKIIQPKIVKVANSRNISHQENPVQRVEEKYGKVEIQQSQQNHEQNKDKKEQIKDKVQEQGINNKKQEKEKQQEFQYVMNASQIPKSEQPNQQEQNQQFYVIQMIAYLKNSSNSVATLKIIHILINKQNHQISIKYPLQNRQLSLSIPIQSYDHFLHINRVPSFIDWLYGRIYMIYYPIFEKQSDIEKIESVKVCAFDLVRKQGDINIQWKDIHEKRLFSILDRQ